jgi:hypothetical protein
MRRAILAAALSALFGAAEADPALDALVAAYPDHLASHDGTVLVWKDGTRMPVSDGRQNKTFQELLDAPDIGDQFRIPYPLGEPKPPALNEDPGRIRFEPLFTKMYGDCRKGEVEKRLRSIAWLPGRGGGTVKVTPVNGVADKLVAVSRELETLPAEMTKYLVPPAGTYNCRVIAGTRRLSVHAFGAALDVSTRFGDYWQWTGRGGTAPAWKNRIPAAIGEIFERHGFIWGAKWHHFDTFHFEYRPEIVALARQGWPPREPVPK